MDDFSEPIYATIDKSRPCITTNLARRSVIQYCLVPAAPSALSSSEELNQIGLSSSNGSLSNNGDEPIGRSSQPPPHVQVPIVRRETTGGTETNTIPDIFVIEPQRATLEGNLTASELPFEESHSQQPARALLQINKRSNSPLSATPKSTKPDSFWDKFGSLGHKKKANKKVQIVEEEGRKAIDAPNSPIFDMSPDEYDLGEGEERFLIEQRSYRDPKLEQLIQVFVVWINNELADQRITVKTIDDDLYDGQVLQKLLEKLTGEKFEVPEVSQSEKGQRHKLQVVLDAVNKIIPPRWSSQKWSVESVHSKSLVAILYLLVHLSSHFRNSLSLPENVHVETVVIKKRNGKLEYRRVTEQLTCIHDEMHERDAFDSLLDHASDKLKLIQKNLLIFVNKHLNKINLEVYDMESQFHDGVYLVLLMGLLEGYFAPLSEFHLTPKDFEEKVFNVTYAFELMKDAGLSKPKTGPEDIVNLDSNSTLRIIYNLFAKYRKVD